MSKTVKSAIQFTIFLGLGLFLVYYAFSGLSDTEIDTVKNAFYSANYWWIGLGFIISGLSHVCRAYRWKMMLQPMNYNPSVTNSFFAVMVGYLANMAFPRLGEVSRCTILTKYEKIPFTTSFGTVVSERIIDTITWLLVISLTILFQFSVLFNFLNTNILLPLQTKFSSLLNNVALLVILAFAGISIVVTLFVFRKKILANPLVVKITTVAKGFIDGLMSIKNLKKPGLFILLSVLIWLGYILVTYVSFFCMPETSTLSFGAAIAIIAFATLAVVLTQGGIGAYPLLAMQVLLLYGVDKVPGLAFGWIIWSAQAFQNILLGFLSLILLPLLNKEKTIVNR